MKTPAVRNAAYSRSTPDREPTGSALDPEYDYLNRIMVLVVVNER
jgi:hypothetical protein